MRAIPLLDNKKFQLCVIMLFPCFPVSVCFHSVIVILPDAPFFIFHVSVTCVALLSSVFSKVLVYT